jgi:predicted nucleic acid-binding protein
MTDLFVDTSAFYALADKKDTNHRRARTCLAALQRKGQALVTTTDVFDEIVTLVRYRLGHPAAVTLGDQLSGSSWCRVLEVTDDIRRGAWDIFVRYTDQAFSFTDCTSFATMRSMHLLDAFTFDRPDFAAAGFVVRPGPGA